MHPAAAAGIGVGLGAVTGMPLGVVNVAIVDAAIAGRPRFALGVGLGGACADGVHAALAFAGIARLVTARPDAMRALAVAAAVLIAGFAIASWRRRAPTARVRGPGGLAAGIASGAALTLPNPGALTGWVAIAAALAPQATGGEAAAFALGVAAGSAGWFTLLGRWAARLPPGHAAARWIPRIAIAALVAIAGYGVVRAFTAS